MPDTNPQGQKPNANAGGAAAKPGRKDSLTNAFFAYFDIAFLAAILGLFASFYFYGFDVNRAFFNEEVFLSLCFVVPLVWGLARRRRVARVICEVLGALFAAGLISMLYLAVCAGVVMIHYATAEAAPGFVDQYFAQVDKNSTGFVTGNQLAAISQEQFALRSVLDDVESDERRLQSDSGLPDATRADVLHHYEAIRQEITAGQLPQAEVDSIESVRDICFVGHPIDNGADCAASREDLLGFKAKIEQAYPQWIALFGYFNRVQ